MGESGVAWSLGKVAGDLGGMELCPAQEAGGGGSFGNNSKTNKDEMPSDPTLALYLPPVQPHSHTYIVAPRLPLPPAWPRPLPAYLIESLPGSNTSMVPLHPGPGI